MERFTLALFSIVTVLFGAFGCGESGPLAPEETGASDYFPLAPGNKWTYTDGERELNLSILLKRATHAEGFKTWVFVWSDGPRRGYCRNTQEGLYLYLSLDSRRQVHVLKYPPRVGGIWVALFEYHVNARYRGVERVVVPAGAFEGCLLVEVLNPARQVICKGWFKPHIGFVKADEIGGLSLRLIDYVLNTD